jgi:hypothetical protein
MVEVRHEMAAPGGLDLFMALAAPLLGGRGISDRRLREVPPTADPHWLALLEAASEAGVSVSSTAAPIPTIRDVEPPSIAEPSPTRLVPVAPSGSLTVAAPRARISTAGRITLMALGFGVLLLMVAVFAVQRSRSADPTDSTDPDSAPSAPREPTVAPAPEWTPEPPDPTAAPVEEPAPSATPASVPATSPGPEPRPSPRPTRSPEPPVEPSPSPVTSPAEPVPVAPVDGCLALVSSPPGGRIWLDGQAMAEHASSSGVEVAHAPGSVGISMGISDVATASVEVAIRPGERSTVRCDLLAHTCRVVPGGACP